MAIFIHTTLGKLFKAGDEVTVDGIPATIRSVDVFYGMYVDYDVPGLTLDDGGPAVMNEWLPWTRILRVEEVD